MLKQYKRNMFYYNIIIKDMTTNDKEYMREYMKKRYNDDKDKAKKYQKALRWKSNKNISNEMWNKYKHNLVEVIKLQELLQLLPIDVVNEIVLQHTTL